VLLNIEMLQWKGGVIGQLSRQVKRWPGKCDVFRPRRPYMGYAATTRMIRLVGQHYGWSDFARIVARRILPRPLRVRTVDEGIDTPRVCSAAVAWAVQEGGLIAPPFGLKDLDVMPADLADSSFADYLFTLYP
jgi:hypothetical protein